MTTFAATHSANVDSSAVEALSYNVNTQELVVDLHDDLYKYPGVSFERYEQLRTAPSVGRDFQALKRSHGPSTYLGRYGQVEFVQDTTKAKPVAKAAAPVTNVGAERFSLAPSPVVNVGSDVTYTVDFRDASGEPKEYTPKGVDSVDAAVEAINELADMLAVDLTVTGVYVSFE